MKYLISIFLTCFIPRGIVDPTDYDKTLVQISTLTIENEPYGIAKFNRRGERVKVKYFACKNYNGESVEKRFLSWSSNKNVIAYSSGTYMTGCYEDARPVGLCIDAGVLVSEKLEMNKLDGLIIVQATGGVVASNLKEGNLTVTYPDKSRRTFNLRNVSKDLEDFKDWAEQTGATVFQTHLFVYKNQLLITPNASQTAQQRRFLAVCKMPNNEIVHYLINLSTPSSIMKGAEKAFNFLQKNQEISELVFLINLDTGCQNIFKLFDSRGNEYNSRIFKGDNAIELKNAANILAYYYE